MPYTQTMSDRRWRWVAALGVVAALLIAPLLFWGGWGGDAAGGASGPAEGAEGAAEALAGGPDQARETSEDGDPLAFGPDAGATIEIPWLPTATVAEDPARPHGSVRGRVTSSRDGAPIEGAELVFLHDGAASSVTTGPEGAFELVAPAPGRYLLSIATAEGFLPYAPEQGHSAISFQARPERRIDGVLVQLRPERRVEVRVVDEAEAPVGGATIRLVGAGAGERTMAPVDDVYVTTEDGRAEVRAWRGVLLEARHPDHGVGRGRVSWRGADATITISLGEAAEDETASESIAGVVLDEARRPLEGALVTAYRQARGLHPSAQVATGPRGGFVLDGLDRGTHVLVTQHPDHPRQRTGPVPTGRDDVEIRLRGGRTIRGRVVDASGEPVPAFHVVARRARSALVRRHVKTVSGYDAEGRFLVTGLPDAEHELVATARGYPPSDPITVTPGGPEVTITLREGGRVVGVVRSEDGSPLAGARLTVEAHLGRGSSAAPTLPLVVSGPDGAFVLDGVGAEPRSIRVTAEGHHGRILSGVPVPPGETQRLDVVLTPVGEGEEPRMELVGIGVNVYPNDEALVIARVLDGGGAQTAGLARGDRILAVDGTPVTALGFRGALERIRGVEGTTVVLRVQRPGSEAPADVPIVRSRVRT